MAMVDRALPRYVSLPNAVLGHYRCSTYKNGTKITRSLVSTLVNNPVAGRFE